MKITRDTEYYGDFANVERYVTDGDKRKIRDAAVADKFGDAGFYGMTVGGLLSAMHGNFGEIADMGDPTVFARYRLEAFGEWVKEFIDMAESLTLKPTAKQAAATSGCLTMTFDESVLVFMRRYFGLPSFDAVNALTVGDYILAKRDAYNQQIIDRNYMTKK